MINSLISFLQRRKYLLAAGIIIVTVVTLYLTLTPADKLVHSKLFTHDKIGHMLMFGSWTFLIGLYNKIAHNRLNLFTVFLIGVGFGIGIELLQLILPIQRDPDIFDSAFDALGCLLAVLSLKKIFAEPENTLTS